MDEQHSEQVRTYRAHRTVCSQAVAILAVLTGTAFGQVQEIPGAMEFSGRLIAKPIQAEALRIRGLGGEEIAARRERAKGVVARYTLHWYEALVDHYVIDLPAGATENGEITALLATGLFEFVEPDWIVYPLACPNDPLLTDQWHHDNSHLDSCLGWDIHIGSPSVGVGICDTGIQVSHPDLLLHRLEGYNAVDKKWESQGGDISPVASHGTETTGCAAANGNNGLGVSGIGWYLSHRMLRVSNDGSGDSSISILTHAALTSVAAGDKVASVSYSGVNNAAVRSTAAQIKDMGGLMVWSAGNDGAYLNWGDRDADDVICVGATDINDNRAYFSAHGPSVDLMAPGVSVLTTTTKSLYASVSGTSFSTPLTAGLIALVWSYKPSLTSDAVEALIKGGCDDLGPIGPDDSFGYGRINSFRTLAVWVDFAYNGTALGTFLQPYNSLAAAAEAVPTGGTVIIKAGSSPETITIDRAMTFKSWNGTVTIGR